MTTRFGLDVGELELDRREMMLITNAVGRQRQYCLGLAARNREPDARERNMVNALELEVLLRKLQAAEPT